MGEHVAEFDDFDQLIAKFPGVTLAPLGVKNTQLRIRIVYDSVIFSDLDTKKYFDTFNIGCDF